MGKIIEEDFPVERPRVGLVRHSEHSGVAAAPDLQAVGDGWRGLIARDQQVTDLDPDDTTYLVG